MAKTGKIQIKAFGIERYDEMRAVWENAGLSCKPKGRDSKKEISKQIEATPDLFMGAFDCEKMVGVCIATDDGRRGWINRLAVLPEYQGKGIARKVVDACEKALRKRGRKIFCAQIEDKNKKSLALFAAAGYKVHNDIIYVTKRESDEV
ncbi:MAG: GNAT family N-acetyltransferase [Candidatus Thermoplasmatota archaeon]|nr:GNAT family N-acetyltransferase [Candidatus Thermoplasmatota archaeon]